MNSIERFMSYVDKLPCGCWYWTGARSRGNGNKKWYGSFWYEGRIYRAHRWAAVFIGGHRELEKGEHRDHTCHFSMCVNPDHLEIVTHEENQRRKMRRHDQGSTGSICEDAGQDLAARPDEDGGRIGDRTVCSQDQLAEDGQGS